MVWPSETAMVVSPSTRCTSTCQASSSSVIVTLDLCGSRSASRTPSGVDGAFWIHNSRYSVGSGTLSFTIVMGKAMPVVHCVNGFDEESRAVPLDQSNDSTERSWDALM